MAKKNMIVTTQELAEILGISERRIQQLVNEMVLDKLGRGKFELNKSVQAFLNYKIESMNAQTGTLLEEQTRLTKIKADMAQLQYQTLQGDLIPADAIETVWGQVVSAARSQLLSIPNKIKSDHSDLDVSIVSNIDKCLRDAMEELGQNDLSKRYNQAAKKHIQELDSAI